MTWAANIVGKAIYYQLKNLCGGRIYPVVMAQDVTYPAVCYTISSTSPEHTKDSKSLVDTVKIQIDVYSKTIDEANATASLVRDQLDFISGTIAGVPVDTCRFDDQYLMYENEVRLHRVSQDYIIRIPNDAQPSNLTSVVTILSISADYAATSIIPPGYMVADVIFENTTGNTAQLSAGTTAGGNDVFLSVGISGNGFTTAPVNKVFSLTGSTSIYFNHASDGDAWNGATVNIYILLTKIK